MRLWRIDVGRLALRSVRVIPSVSKGLLDALGNSLDQTWPTSYPTWDVDCDVVAVVLDTKAEEPEDAAQQKAFHQ